MNRLLILLFCLPLFAMAQDKPLIVQGTSPNLYLNHTVAPKENYYSIGRMYNISPKEFAPFNNLTLDKGLALGQVIKIPLTTSNFLQSGTAAPGEVLVPVYHTIKDKEGLYHISDAYNKVPIATLKKWNNISGNEVNNGTNLVIGYLKVKKDLSSLAAQAVATTGLSEEPVIETAKPVNAIPEKEVVVAPAEPEKKDEPKPVEQPQVKPEIKEKEPAVVTTEPLAVNNKTLTEGAFKIDYLNQTHGKDIVKESGAAAEFKSTSGWQDEKYYCLYNTTPSGTVVKIINNATGKSVYAKVLDIVPDIKQNDGLLIRLSNAAAEQLGVTDESKFDCTVEYSK